MEIKTAKKMFCGDLLLTLYYELRWSSSSQNTQKMSQLSFSVDSNSEPVRILSLLSSFDRRNFTVDYTVELWASEGGSSNLRTTGCLWVLYTALEKIFL